MKLKKDTLYTIIDDDFEKLHIFPESGYTVWQTYDSQSNHDSWYAIPTDDILDDLEKFVVSIDDDDEIELGLDEMGDSFTDFLYQSLENDRYSRAIIHDGNNDDPYFAYYVGEDEVDDSVGNHRAGHHVHLTGEDEEFLTSEEISCYYLGWSESDGVMYFKDGFSEPPVSIDDFIIEAD